MKTAIKIWLMVVAAAAVLLAATNYVNAQDAGVLDAGLSVPADAGVTAPGPMPSPDSVDLGGVLGNIQSGKWLWAFGGILVLAVRYLRPLFAKKVKWFETRLGGKVFAGVCALLLSLGASMAEGQLSMGVLGIALSLAWIAAGQHEHAKDAGAALKRKV